MTSLLCALPFVASLFSVCNFGEPLAVGYVEGEYVLLAPIESARIESITVRKGDRVKAGDKLVALEKDDAESAVAEARAAAKQAAAELDNLQRGKRPEEISVIEASIASSKAQLKDAERKQKRLQDLRKSGFASQAEFDAAETGVELAQAKVNELEANLDVARLPAREGEIIAASGLLDKSNAALDIAEWKLKQRTIGAPAEGMISDVILREGEVSGPAAPVLSLLPDGAVKLKLYLPEADLSQVRQGTLLEVRCDGCGTGQSARVSYVSDEPEFTPPVIYSTNNRQKLVFLVEARPEPGAQLLKPGQIVDVALARTGGDGS